MADIDCLLDLDAFAREVPDDDLVEDLWQDVLHRLIEEYGSNPDDLDRGCGLVDALSSNENAGLPAAIQGDLTKDTRIASVQVRLSKGTTVGAYVIELQIQPTNAALGILNRSFTVDEAGNVRVA